MSANLVGMLQPLPDTQPFYLPIKKKTAESGPDTVKIVPRFLQPCRDFDGRMFNDSGHKNGPQFLKA
jgi:hypothetical protein